MTARSGPTRSGREPRCIACFAGALILDLATSLSARAESEPASGARVSEQKLTLSQPGEGAGLEPLVLCSARIVEGSSDLALFCRHDLGEDGLVSLVRADSWARSEPAFWTAPLASPFGAVAALSDEALAALSAGELVLRIEVRGLVVEGEIGTPIFDSGFDVFSLCEWSNFPCFSDGNPCTDEVCNSTGACSHPNDNTNTCTLPNATGGCFNGNCAIVTACNPGYSHCDFNQANGCEIVHNSNSGICGVGNDVGAHGGDVFCGLGCTTTDEVTFATRTGLGENWYYANAEENSSCSSPLSHDVYLTVPEGIDYDLYIYAGCQLIDSSVGATGEDEFVSINTAFDEIATDDSFFYQVEVRYYSGHSCEEWTLGFVGRDCN